MSQSTSKLPTSSSSGSLLPTSARRGGCLTTWLIFMSLSSVFLLYDFLSTYSDLERHDDPTLPHWPFLVLALLCVNQMIGIIGLFLWRKWGLYLVILSGLGSLATNLAFGVSIAALLPYALLTIIGLAIMISLVRSDGKWAHFRW